jgi:hypothetical protein
MKTIAETVSELRARPDVGVADEPRAWRACVSRGDILIEVTIPHGVLEWHAKATHRHEKRELWSDWMDYEGYDDRPKTKLEEDMARDVLAFIDRMSMAPLTFPLSIYKE